MISHNTYPIDIRLLGLGEVSGCASDLEPSLIASNHFIYQPIVLGF